MHGCLDTFIHPGQRCVKMYRKADQQESSPVGMRSRLKAFFPKRLLSPSRTIESGVALPIEQANSGDGGSQDVQTNTASEGRVHGVAHNWDEAWASIQSEEPELVAKYQQYLLAQEDPDAKLSPVHLSGKDRKEKLLRTADLKVTEAKAKLAEGGVFNGHLKKVAEGTVAILIKGTGIVTAIANTEPHAAIVWAGCSVVLPVSIQYLMQGAV